jgi:hypothetical protein
MVGETLLVADVLVGCQKDFKGGLFGGSQEFSVAQRIPTIAFVFLIVWSVRNERRGAGVP